MNLSNVASSAGNNNRIIRHDTKVPPEIDWHILAAIAVAKLPTIAVTKIKILAEVKIEWIDFL